MIEQYTNYNNIQNYVQITYVHFQFHFNTLFTATHVLLDSDFKAWHHYLSRVMRKPTFCICENKDADQLRGNREADQRLCFRYIDSTIPLLSKSEISSL